MLCYHILSLFRFSNCGGLNLNTTEKGKMQKKMKQVLEKIAELSNNRAAKIHGDETFRKYFGKKVQLVRPIVMRFEDDILRLSGGTGEAFEELPEEESTHRRFKAEYAQRSPRYGRAKYRMFVCGGGAFKHKEGESEDG